MSSTSSDSSPKSVTSSDDERNQPCEEASTAVATLSDVEKENRESSALEEKEDSLNVCETINISDSMTENEAQNQNKTQDQSEALAQNEILIQSEALNQKEAVHQSEAQDENEAQDQNEAMAQNEILIQSEAVTQNEALRRRHSSSEESMGDDAQLAAEAVVDANINSPLYASLTKSSRSDASEDNSINLYENHLYHRTRDSKEVNSAEDIHDQASHDGSHSSSDYGERIGAYEEIKDYPYYSEEAPLTSSESLGSHLHQNEEIYEDVIEESDYHVLQKSRSSDSETDDEQEESSDNEDNSSEENSDSEDNSSDEVSVSKLLYWEKIFTSCSNLRLFALHYLYEILFL